MLSAVGPWRKTSWGTGRAVILYIAEIPEEGVPSSGSSSYAIDFSDLGDIGFSKSPRTSTPMSIITVSLMSLFGFSNSRVQPKLHSTGTSN